MGIRGSVGQSQSQNGQSPVLLTVNALSPTLRIARPRFAHTRQFTSEHKSDTRNWPV